LTDAPSEAETRPRAIKEKTTMQVEIAVLSDAANISREGKLNICGVFQNIYGQSTPIGWPLMALVLQVRLSPEETGRKHTLVIRLKGPDGKVLQQFPEAHFEAMPDPLGRRVTVPMTVNFAGLMVPSFGTYAFEISIGGTSLTSVELEVSQLSSQQPAQAA
jgi:hypothetical protein